MELTQLLLITGLLAFLGALLFAIGDVLLLGGKINIEDYPKLKPYLKLLSDAEIIIARPPAQIMLGALLGVFAAPLVLPGFWQVYHGLQGANPAMTLTTAVLFGISSVIGAFVHGSFYFMGEYVHALNKVDESSQPIIADMIARHKKILIITYAPVLIMIIIASILFSILVAGGSTQFPVWMAWVTPLTMTMAWLLLKRFLPQFVRDLTEGAGFNIAYMAFFACTTFSLWQG